MREELAREQLASFHDGPSNSTKLLDILIVLQKKKKKTVH